MQEMLLDGMTYGQIGKHYGVTRQRVQQLLSPPYYIRQQVEKRSNGRCEDCGIIVQSRGQLHHRLGDLTELNSLDDLQGVRYLCASCHRRHHGKGGIGILELDLTKDEVKQLKSIAIDKEVNVRQLIKSIIEKELVSSSSSQNEKEETEN